MALPPFRSPTAPPYVRNPPGVPQFHYPPPVPRRTLGLRGRQWAWFALVLAAGYTAMSGISITGAVGILKREPTAAELRRAADAEVARRWQAWPVGRIFPERLSYVPQGAPSEFATRAGIAPDTGCEGSVDPATATVLRQLGCRGVVRATYADQLQGVVVTVGVVAFPDQQTAYKARQLVPGSPTALRAAAFPGTTAARFDDQARQSGSAIRGGPYLVLTTAGQADGRPAKAVGKSRPGAIFVVAPQLADRIARTLSTRALPDCKSHEWQC